MSVVCCAAKEGARGFKPNGWPRLPNRVRSVGRAALELAWKAGERALAPTLSSLSPSSSAASVAAREGMVDAAYAQLACCLHWLVQ